MISVEFVKEVDSTLVTRLLIEKGIITDEYNAQRLYRSDKYQLEENKNDMKRIKSITLEEFMAMFSKRLFKYALTKTTDKIKLLGLKN